MPKEIKLVEEEWEQGSAFANCKRSSFGVSSSEMPDNVNSENLTSEDSSMKSENEARYPGSKFLYLIVL